ncbi:MAG: hypothetical protein P8P74_11050 [Crocinitomicaceae bacterium]|nr:hypothetical protein [Crocinitomicaceae bacterium]
MSETILPEAEIEVVQLQSIDFSYQDSDHTTSSLLFYPFSPSWIPRNFSYAAYSIEDTKAAIADRGLSIWARFLSEEFKGKDIYVRAVPITPEKAISEETVFPVFIGSEYAKDVFGEVEYKRLSIGLTGQSIIDNIDSNIPMKIINSKFAEAGVGVFDVILNWQYQELTSGESAPLDDKWKNIRTSKHRIFLVLSVPKSPWTDRPFRNIYNGDFTKSPIWTEALSISCEWARGAKNIRQAGRKIADKLNESSIFEYSENSDYSDDTPPEKLQKITLDVDYKMMCLFL